MDLVTNIKGVLYVLALLLGIDGVYLYFTAGPFVKMVEKIQGAKVQVKLLGVAISYLCMAVLLYMFGRESITQTFLLGALTYGVYDGVNYALFTKYDGWVALQDVIWGGTLFSIVGYLRSF